MFPARTAHTGGGATLWTAQPLQHSTCTGDLSTPSEHFENLASGLTAPIHYCMRLASLAAAYSSVSELLVWQLAQQTIHLSLSRLWLQV